jgi:MFS family permease
MTSMGVGSFLGALIMTTKSRGGPKIWILLSGAVGMSLFTIIIGFEKVYILACILLLIIGVCTIVFTASVNSIIQLNSEDKMRGRVMSVYALVFGGVTPIGSLFAGKIAESAGAPLCLIICGIIGVGATVIISMLLLSNKDNVSYQQEA